MNTTTMGIWFAAIVIAMAIGLMSGHRERHSRLMRIRVRRSRRGLAPHSSL